MEEEDEQQVCRRMGVSASVYLCVCLCFSFVYTYIMIVCEHIVNCGRCLCVCTVSLRMRGCILTTVCRREHSDPKVWMHLLQELSSRCENSTKTERARSKTSVFTHSKSARHKGGEAQTVFPQNSPAELFSPASHKWTRNLNTRFVVYILKVCLRSAA